MTFPFEMVPFLVTFVNFWGNESGVEGRTLPKGPCTNPNLPANWGPTVDG